MLNLCSRSGGGVKVLVNGCWDLLHTGHYNALRQVKQSIPKDWSLVAGIHSNEEIRRVKGGAFINSDKDKATMLMGCKYVDEIIENVPYTTMTPALLDQLGVDYTAHGDDVPILPDGTRMYKPVEEAGRYLIFKRSEGISTTNLINRLLSKTAVNAFSDTDVFHFGQSPSFTLTTERISAFSNFPSKRIEDARHIVYIDGAFDLFHPDHLEVLEIAKSFGDFLLVGVHSDSTVKDSYMQYNDCPQFTVMTTGERALNLLSSKFVDDVIVSSPLTITSDFIASLSIKTLCIVENHSDFINSNARYSEVEGIVKVEKIPLIQRTSTRSIIDSVNNTREIFIQRNKKKKDPSFIELRH
jgi:ethanolamine-phosphate cytidylyltransferase